MPSLPSYCTRSERRSQELTAWMTQNKSRMRICFSFRLSFCMNPWKAAMIIYLYQRIDQSIQLHDSVPRGTQSKEDARFAVPPVIDHNQIHRPQLKMHLLWDEFHQDGFLSFTKTASYQSELMLLGRSQLCHYAQTIYYELCIFWMSYHCK